LDLIPDVQVLAKAVNEYQPLAAARSAIRGVDIPKSDAFNGRSMGHSHAKPFSLRHVITLAIVTSLYQFLDTPLI
jgi:hypothetical protein